jgi:hypothetical protein
LSENGTGNRVGCKNDNKKSALSFLIDSSCAIPHLKKQDTYTDSRFWQKNNEYKTDDNYGSKKQNQEYADVFLYLNILLRKIKYLQ